MIVLRSTHESLKSAYKSVKDALLEKYADIERLQQSLNETSDRAHENWNKAYELAAESEETGRQLAEAQFVIARLKDELNEANAVARREREQLLRRVVNVEAAFQTMKDLMAQCS